ncbi:DMT family transporter [Mycoplasmopsis caviae]|uniref:DMT family transporter n=1 Tax=Mycoplasmopsis caviae TaxID=55603 RepID=A0A3P8LAX8_9BACT|nr:DMT family transporter [Mycoplasmopsis caviae]UUD35093.1 DMT family transporter [Mycoplasmopsis caviae]VDR42091.1 EamA-like transporter family [Mycoplasmopsis caviae]
MNNDDLSINTKEQKNNKNKDFFNKSIALFSGIMWALNGVLISTLSKLLPQDSYFIIGHLGQAKLALMLTFLSDLFGLLTSLIIIFSFKKHKEFFAAFRNKNIWILLLSSFFGAPLGMTMYVLGIIYVGTGISSAITVCYPVIGAMLAFIFLKQKTTKNGLFGSIISLLCILTLGILQFQKGDIKNGWGFLFAIIAALCWALESFLSTLSMKNSIDPFVSIFFRYVVSIFVLGVFVLPSLKIYGHSRQLFSNLNTLLIVGSGVVACISYMTFYYALDKNGIPLTTGLNISYVAWTIIFDLMRLEFYSYYFYILSILILLSQIITLLPDDKFIFRNWKRQKTKCKVEDTKESD